MDGLFFNLKMKKQPLLILSDLWGLDQWYDLYTERLSHFFNVQLIDCCELGGIVKIPLEEKSLHHQFINGGINQAVNRLNEIIESPTHLLGLSVGGSIAWNCALNNPLIESVTCVSSTRLRKEIVKPSCATVLYYGEHDIHQPKKDWYQKLFLSPCITFSNEKHQAYKKPEFINNISNDLISHFGRNN